MDYRKESLKLHKSLKGKIEVTSKVKTLDKDTLSLLYSPGVAEPSKAIAKNKDAVYTYTGKGNTIAVISDGSAVLGLGNIGPEAALPVMEGKALLFKAFAGVNAIPICLDTQDPEKIIETVKLLAPNYGGINLEDIRAPECVYIQETLDKALDIPVFHDDQDGTAIVTLAALLNAAKLVGKPIESLKVVISGMGAAGSSIAKLFHKFGIKSIYGFQKEGVIKYSEVKHYNPLVKDLCHNAILLDPPTNTHTLSELVKNTDVFIGVSVGNILEESAIKTMNDKPIIFAMANPEPEINPQKALNAGAFIVGTGRSDYPNQINNVLAFPGIFKGALEARVASITDTMKINAAIAIAGIIKENELTQDYIIPSPFDKRVVKSVSKAIKNV